MFDDILDEMSTSSSSDHHPLFASHPSHMSSPTSIMPPPLSTMDDVGGDSDDLGSGAGLSPYQLQILKRSLELKFPDFALSDGTPTTKKAA